MTNVTVRARRSRRSNDTRQQIVDAAGELFAAAGYEATSIGAVAAAAGVTRATVYYHFDSKEALLWGVVGPYVMQTIEHLEHLVAESGSARTAIIRLVSAMIRGAQNPKQRYLYYQEILPLTPEMRVAIREQERQYEALVARVIEQAQQDGHVREGDPKVMALILIGAIARTARWYDPKGSVPSEEFEATCADFMLKGLLIEPR